MVAGGGWQWLSGTRNYQFVPYDSVGLRAAAKKLRQRRNKKKDDKTAKEGEKKTEEEKEMKDNIEESEKTKTETGEDSKKDEDTEKTSTENASQDSSQKEEDNKQEEEKMEVDSTSGENTQPPPLPEILNVSDAIKDHTFYPKVTKPYSRLDNFLEKREKQYEIELKQKLAVEQIIARYKKQEDERKKLLAAQQQQRQKEGTREKGKVATEEEGEGEDDDDVDVVGDKSEERIDATINGEMTDAVVKQKEVIVKRPPSAVVKHIESSSTRQRRIEEDQESIDGDEETDEESVDEEELGVLDDGDDYDPNDEDDADEAMSDDDTGGDDDAAASATNAGAAQENASEANDVRSVGEAEMTTQESSAVENDVTVTGGGDGTLSTENNADQVVTPGDAEVTESACGSVVQESCSTAVPQSEEQHGAEEAGSTEMAAVQQEESQATPGDDSMEIPQVDGTGDEKVDSQTGSVHVVVKDGVVTTTTTSSGNTVPRIIPKIVPTSNSVTSSKAAAATTTAAVTTATKSAAVVAKQGNAVATAANLLAIQNSAVGQAVHALIQGSKIQLTASAVADLESKLKLIGDTKESCNLIKFKARGAKQTLASKNAKNKSLPTCQKFTIKKGGKKSLFILEKHDARRLARKSGKKETPGFKYDCKMNNVNWPYPCPRPTFKTCWRWRTQNVQTLGTVAVQLRVLYASIRWDDLGSKPPTGGTNTITTETDITTTELLKRRDIGPFGLKSEYLVRKIVVPIGMPEQPKCKFRFSLAKFMSK